MSTEVKVLRQIETIEKVGRKTEEYNITNYKESMDFKLKHTTLKDMVRQILRQDIQARSDYTWLCLLVWIKQDAIKLIIPLEDFKKMYKPESISRVSRELVTEAKQGEQSLKWLLNDTETLDKRINLQNLNRNYFIDKKIENESMIYK